MINLVAPINTLGYGIASYNILRELIKRDQGMVLYTIGEPDFTNDLVIGAIKNQQDVINHIRALEAARGMYMGVGGANVPPTIPPLANPSQMTRLTNPQAAIINSMINLSQVPQGIGTIGAINPNPYANQYTSRSFFNQQNPSFRYR